LCDVKQNHAISVLCTMFLGSGMYVCMLFLRKGGVSPSSLIDREGWGCFRKYLFSCD
jgi:hypothetical protein